MSSSSSPSTSGRHSCDGLRELGYDAVTLPDHFGDQLGTIPALMAAAAATTTLRLGALVWDNDFRHPAVFAKDLATLDRLSGGRLEIGIGAGWEPADYAKTGMPFDAIGVRITRLEESLKVLKGLFSDGPFSFQGEHYTIENYDAYPKPLQRPLPILVGGGGLRMLGIACREADIISLSPHMGGGLVGSSQTMGPNTVDSKVAFIEEHTSGRSVERHIRLWNVLPTRDRDREARAMAEARGMTVQEVRESPYLLIGTAEQMVEDLRARRERWGFSYYSVAAPAMEEFAVVVEQVGGR